MSTRVKAKYVSFFLFINLAVYFLIQNHVTKNEYDLMTQFDRAVPFMPQYIWIYLWLSQEKYSLQLFGHLRLRL